MTKQLLAPMLAQIEQKPDTIKQILNPLDRSARFMLNFERCYEIHDIIICGSGDSYAAALSAASTMRRYSQLPVMPLNSMTASRYCLPYLKEMRARRTLVIVISNSGGAARSNEALQMAKAAGTITLAVTGRVDSEFARSADMSLDISVPNVPAGLAPGILSHMATQLALILIGLRIGEVTGNLAAEVAGKLRQQFLAVSPALAGFTRDALAVSEHVAKAYGQESRFEFLGSGPNYGSAVFAAAKAIETAGIEAVGEDIEEFHHLQFFEKRRPMPTVLMAPLGNSYARAQEIAHELKKLERQLVAVVQQGEEEIAKLADYCYLIPADTREEFTPLFIDTAMECLAYALALETGAKPFRNFEGNWQGDALPYSGIRSSRRISSLDELI